MNGDEINNITIVTLGAAGALATITSALGVWKQSRRSKKNVTVRVTRNDGSSVLLDTEALKTLDPDMLKAIITELVPEEERENPYDDLDEDDADPETTDKGGADPQGQSSNA